MRTASMRLSPRDSATTTTVRRSVVLRQPWDDVLVGPTCAPPSVKLATGLDAALGAMEQEQKALVSAQKSVDQLLREADRDQSKMVSSFLHGTAAWLDSYYHISTISPRKVPTLTGQVATEPIATRRNASPALGSLREACAFLSPRKSGRVLPSRSRDAFATEGTLLLGSVVPSSSAGQFNWAHFSPAVESARQAHLPRVVASIPAATTVDASQRLSPVHAELEVALNELLYRCESFLQENVDDDFWCFDVAAEKGLLKALGNESDDSGLASRVFSLLRHEACLRTPNELMLDENVDELPAPNRTSEKRRASQRKSSTVLLPAKDRGALYLAVERVRRGEGPSRSQWRRLGNALRSALETERNKATV